MGFCCAHWCFEWVRSCTQVLLTSRPSALDMRMLAGMGFCSFFNLLLEPSDPIAHPERQDEESERALGVLVTEAGLVYQSLVVPALGPCADDVLLRVVSETDSLLSSPAPVLVHCGSAARARAILTQASKGAPLEAFFGESARVARAHDTVVQRAKDAKAQRIATAEHAYLYYTDEQLPRGTCANHQTIDEISKPCTAVGEGTQTSPFNVSAFAESFSLPALQLSPE